MNRKQWYIALRQNGHTVQSAWAIANRLNNNGFEFIATRNIFEPAHFAQLLREAI